jgi:hypothetical protein
MTGDFNVDNDVRGLLEQRGWRSEQPALNSGGVFVSSGVPNVARIYDALLGGKDNYAVDRAAADAIIRQVPDARKAAHDNRRFLRRAVRFLAAEAGIRQFLDIGTGLPTKGPVHEVAQGICPDAHVVYVDYDPVVVTHAKALLANHNDTVIAIRGDLRSPQDILDDPELRELIDFDQPVAVLMIAILHFIVDEEDPYGLVSQFKSAMPPGSYLAVSHATSDNLSGKDKEEVQAVYDDATSRATPRSLAEIRKFFDGLAITEPGVVDISAWRSKSHTARALFYGGIGRKP